MASDRTHPGEVKACRRHIRAILRSLEHEVEPIGFQVATGCSGSIESVALMAHAKAGGGELRTLNGFRLTRDDVAGAVDLLVAAGTVRKRREIPGLDPRRADIALAGSLVLDEVMDTFAIEDLVLSDYALREGVLLDTLERWSGSARHHLRDVRHRSVLHLAELCDPDPEHSSQVAHLALRLFDETAELHGLGDADRELLEAAALLANVGLFVSHDMHHKHSYYVIRNTEHLQGFTDHEIERIALVARYHRKSAPIEAHPEFAALDEEERAVVQVLAGLLRIGIGLDRTHEGRVRGIDVHVRRKKARIEIVPEAAEGADLTLEVYSAQERVALLEQALGVTVRITALGPERSVQPPRS
jgi:exopolyphosphatase/guanosine-5'-triphosphate,3'-diphosphate pyrophosphatase